ncbi:MAG: hypothetical protein R6X20_19370, partial [Phycisphaerae bacterium]
RGRAAALLALAAACLLGGCDSGGAPAPLRPAGGPASREFGASSDPAVMDLGLHVAWYYAHGGRLPASLAPVREHVRVPGWPALPETTRDGRPVRYRRADERTFEILVGDPAGPAGRRTAVAIHLPETVPNDLSAEAFATWWELEFIRQQTQRLKQRLEELQG